MHPTYPLQFPVDALPSPLYELALELQRNTKAPWELIASSLLSSMSLACQGSANVQVPNGINPPSPISIYLTALIESGGGKTTLDKIVSKPFGEFEVKQAEFLKQQRTQYKAAMIAWNIKKKAFEKAIEKASKIDAPLGQTAGASVNQRIGSADPIIEAIRQSGDSLAEVFEVAGEQSTVGEVANPTQAAADQSLEEFGDQLIPEGVDRLKEQLAQHLAQEPLRPRNVKIMYNNASPAAILRSLYENWPSASLSSDEAGGIFNGQALADLAMINKLWEGGTIHVERIESDSFILRNARLTLALMVQPKVFRKYLERRGDEARAIGLFARCFICCPVSSLGTRFIGHVPPVWQHLPMFHARITELLEQNLLELEAPEFTRPTLEFSPDAKQLWINAFNEVESYLYPGQYFSDISDYGAKFGENLARLAALFHFFGGETGEISYETTNRALAICRWFMEEFKRLFASAPELPVEISDANELEAWLVKLCHRYPGWTEIRKNVIAQLGPNQLRSSKIRREAALYILACNNKLRFELRGKTTVIVLNPAFFPVPAIAIFPPFYQSQLPGQIR